MTDARRPDLVPVARAEARVIKHAFRHAGIHVKTEPAPDGGIAFMYQKGVLLVRDEDLNRVLAIVVAPETEILDPVYPEGRFPPERPVLEEGEEGSGESGPEAAGDTGEPEAWRPQLRRVTRGLVALALFGSRFEDDDHRDDDAEPQDEQGPSGVLLALNEIDRQLGAEVATPNHVVTVSPVVPCMAHEAEEVPLGIEPEPGPCPGHGGAGVRIFVADTGLVDGAEADHAWMAGVRGDPDPDPAVIPPGHNPDDLLPYAGHGTFVTGVLRCAAPAAEIYCANVFNVAGSALEADAVPKLDRALDEGYGLFNLTISASTRKLLPLAAFNAWRRRLRESKGVACVVAAGNNGLEQPFWPAAFSGMIAVGALAADGRSRASFSNYGSWVDVYARGRGLVNAWGSGEYHCYVPPHIGPDRHFHGMARCSGTSFSTPIVTGRIADRMSRTGENAEQAATAVLARARFIPGVGRVVRPCPDEDCRHGDCGHGDCRHGDCGDQGGPAKDCC
jgi:subtilisin family serine protease